MKECRVCGDVKPVTEYHKNSRAIDGLFSDCKKCRKIKAAKYYKENKQKILQQNKEWSNKNKKRHKFIQARWEHDNKEARRIKQNKNAKERYNRNPHKVCEYVSRRHAKKIKAMPTWLTNSHIKEIKNIYKLSQERSVETNIKHHVDHIVPLNGKDVCGLHVPWNLQVITASENCAKSNKY